MKKAFKDNQDGYYEVFVNDGEPLPNWVNGMTETELMTPVIINLIPSTVSMRQARLALLQFGVLEMVNSAIENGTEADKITWEYAAEVNRSDALVANMASALGLSNEELDGLFTLANSL